MNNQVLNTINNYFENTTVEQTVKTHILDILASYPSENTHCLNIEDNTLNGIDTKKNSWRAHFVNLTTEEDFYIEVSVTPFGAYKRRCYIIGDVAINQINNFLLTVRVNNYKNIIAERKMTII